LCGFGFGGDRATGADVTPYAAAYDTDRSAWWAMSEWVWFAGPHRLKHLAMMRSSDAARRFARINILLMAFVFALTQIARGGWHAVTALRAAAASDPVKPMGGGWFRAAAAPPGARPTGTTIELWWNPAQALIAAALAIIAGVVALFALSAIVRAAVRLAHRAAYRDDQRMSAAILYSTAWSIPLLIGGALMALRPIARIGSVAGWAWYPPDQGVVLGAGVVGGFGVVMWWFWLVRLGSTAPAPTRGRVVAMFALGVPLIAAGAAAGAVFGVDVLLDALFDVLGLRFA
jgi:hypothetical protein